MLENLVTDKLDYKKLSPEEQQKRGILGRLVGVIADSKNATRNGRKYSEKLWENVFKDPIMKERIETNCCFGELGHPTDREETDMEKIAICMDGLPKKDSNGRLQAVFNILDTPNGRILKTLCDYGCKIGVSSRGSGEVSSNFDGTEDVDPDSYECQGFDAVIIPAVKEARLNYVTEQLDKTRYNKTLRAKLQESYNKASVDDKRIMKETFDNIGVKFEKSYPVEFTYTYESDDTPYTNYFGHLNVVADSEKEALEKAEAYVNSPEYQNYNLHQHSFRQFRIADTKYTNVDLVEEVKDQKYYKLVEYDADSGENGMEGDNFYVLEVIPANSEQEAVELLNPPTDDDSIYVTEATKEEYEEYLQYKDNSDYVDFDINEALKQNNSLKEYTTYWFGEKEYPLNFDNGMYDPHTGQFEDGSTLDDYDEEDMAWFDIDEALNESKLPDTAKILDSGYCNSNEWTKVKAEQVKKYKSKYPDVKCVLQKSDTKGQKMWATYTNLDKINESKFIQPRYHDGDVVFIGDANGYQGTFLIRGDISKLPEKLYSNIRKITKYGNTEDPIYKVEYKLTDGSRQFEEDYKKFFDYVEKLLTSSGIKLIKDIKDESLDIDESLSATTRRDLTKAIIKLNRMINSKEHFHATEDFWDDIEMIRDIIETCSQEDFNNSIHESINEVNNIAVDNNEAMVEQLQALLTRNADLESKVIELQEKLSVCYAKENLTEDKIASYKTAIKSLTQDNTKAKALVEKLNTTEEKVKDYSGRISTLESLLKNSVDAKKTLKERLDKKSEEISSLKEQLASLNKSKEKLNEDFNGSEKERDLLKKQYEEKLENSKQLIEKYKSVAKNAVNKYINSQAVRIGVKPEEIKNKLPETYGFNDIDSICEDLKQYKISVGRLPFNAEMLRENKVKMTATPSKNDPLTGLGNIDDDVDSQLLSLAKIN